MNKEEFYKYGESLGIKINDLQRLRMLCKDETINTQQEPEDFSDWDVTLMDGLENEPPYISDDFQIGNEGAYEHTNEHEIIKTQKELIDLLMDQLADLTMMSKIELGDDVIEEIRRLKRLLNEMGQY